MHNPATVLENDTHKLQCDFNLQTDQLIPARRPDLIIINKRKKKRKEKLQNCRLCCSGGPQTSCPSDSCKKPSAKTDVKNSNE